MLARWTLRGLWALLLVVLVLAPARIAHSPDSAQAASADAVANRSPSRAPATIAWVVIGSTILAVPVLIALRRRMPRS